MYFFLYTLVYGYYYFFSHFTAFLVNWSDRAAAAVFCLCIICIVGKTFVALYIFALNNVQNNNKKNGRQQQITTNKLQVPTLGQAHTECM